MSINGSRMMLYPRGELCDLKAQSSAVFGSRIHVGGPHA
jgi:hypothetical protein